MDAVFITDASALQIWNSDIQNWGRNKYSSEIHPPRWMIWMILTWIFISPSILNNRVSYLEGCCIHDRCTSAPNMKLEYSKLREKWSMKSHGFVQVVERTKCESTPLFWLSFLFLHTCTHHCTIFSFQDLGFVKQVDAGPIKCWM